LLSSSLDGVANTALLLMRVFAGWTKHCCKTVLVTYWQMTCSSLGTTKERAGWGAVAAAAEQLQQLAVAVGLAKYYRNMAN
jgi:hypothetical protein